MSASQTDTELAGALAYLVVRAGARDGMAWWDDEALTEAGTYALSRIFPRNPALVAARLALRAARARHAGVLSAASVAGATTLLDFAEVEEGFLRAARILETTPISSAEGLRTRLVGVEPEIASVVLPTPSPEGLVDVTEIATGALGQRAIVLAAGYLLGAKDRAVFPFLRVASGE